MRWQCLVYSLAVFVSSANAVFQDDAFHIDFHHALLGTPLEHATFFHKPQSKSDASLLYTISEKGVLGVVNPKDGSLLWRQPLAGSDRYNVTEAYLIAGDDGTVTSAYEATIQTWDALTGKLVWDYQLAENHVARGLQLVPASTTVPEGQAQDIIVASGPVKDGTGGRIYRISGMDGQRTWEHPESSITSDTSISVAVSAKHVYVVTKSSGLLSAIKTRTIILDTATGKASGSSNAVVDSEALGLGGSYVIHTSATTLLASAEKPYKAVKIHALDSGKLATLSLDTKGAGIEDVKCYAGSGTPDAIPILISVKTATGTTAEVVVLNALKGDITKKYSLPEDEQISTFSVASGGRNTYFAKISATGIFLYSADSPAPLRSFSATSDAQFPRPSFAAVEVSSKGTTGLAVRSALVTAEGDFVLVQNAAVKWSRSESLAYLTDVVWAQDNEISALAQEIEVETASNPLAAYLHRVRRHITELKGLPDLLGSLSRSILGRNEASTTSIRQRLMGGKLVVGVTTKQTVIALNAANLGSIIWRVDLSDQLGPNIEAVHLAVADTRLTAYYSDGTIVVVDTGSGTVLEVQKRATPFMQVIELPASPAAAVVEVLEDGKPQVFTDLAPAVPTEGNSLITLNAKGQANGWTIGSTVEQTWTVSPPANARFVHATTRPSHDPISSIGKVLGDRSVLYKYLSPNIALLTALSSTTLTVYLVNAVTGAVLHTADHDGVLLGSPVSSVLSENWFAYSFSQQNPEDSGLLTQLVVGELYESEMSNDRGLLSSQTNYSSYAPDASVKPHVIERAYTLAEPMAHLSVSQSMQGITNRVLLGYLPQSHAIVGLPRDLVNARRIIDRNPTALEAEEGLSRYQPNLELDPKLVLSHSRDTVGIRRILAAPSLLESTGFVFAYGHDVFGTQVSPSGTYDVLGQDFKRIQLVLTVVALYVGVLALRPMVRKQMVERGWR